MKRPSTPEMDPPKETPAVHLSRGSLEVMSGENFEKTLKDLNLLEPLRCAKTIFIKANLCAGGARGPENGTNVSVQTSESLIRLISTINDAATITIGESDSTGLGIAPDKFERLGYDLLEKNHPNVRLIDLSRVSSRAVQNVAGRLNRFLLPQPLLDADFVISLAKIKTHNIVGVTGSLKNHFGSLPEMRKDVHHPFLHQVITDVNSCIKTELSILDGNPAMEGDGPVRGTPKPLHLTILGNNPVATDFVMAQIMGRDPRKIRYLKLAAKRGLGPASPQQIRMSGEPIDLVSTTFRPPPIKIRVVMKISLGVQRLGQQLVDAGHQLHRLSALTDIPRVLAYARKTMQARRGR